MTRSASKSPEEVLKAPVEPGSGLSSGDPVGAGLRGFGPLVVFGAIFAVTGRIWMLMCAHAAFDLTALAIIYWNLESEVADLVFK